MHSTTFNEPVNYNVLLKIPNFLFFIFYDPL